MSDHWRYSLFCCVVTGKIISMSEFFCLICQIGLRSDSGIASIYDESGVEIENAELLFTEEGRFSPMPHLPLG